MLLIKLFIWHSWHFNNIYQYCVTKLLFMNIALQITRYQGYNIPMLQQSPKFCMLRKISKDDNPFCSWEITLEVIPAPLTWLKHTLLLYWIAVTDNIALIKTIFVILSSSSLIMFSTAVKSFDIWVNFKLF